jgi:hypothetical protein
MKMNRFSLDHKRVDRKTILLKFCLIFFTYFRGLTIPLLIPIIIVITVAIFFSKIKKFKPIEPKIDASAANYYSSPNANGYKYDYQLRYHERCVKNNIYEPPKDIDSIILNNLKKSTYHERRLDNNNTEPPIDIDMIYVASIKMEDE